MMKVFVNQVYIFVLILSSVFCDVSFLYGQQNYMYTQNYVLPIVFNPAATGNQKSINVGLMHRNQWVGIPGAPVTSSALVDSPLKNELNGIGGQFTTDQTGIFITSSFRVLYGHRFRLGINKSSDLFVGASAGLIDQKVDFTKAIVVNNNEPFLFQTAQRQTSLNGSFGIIYKFRTLEVGAALPLILANRLEFKDNKNNAYFNQSRQFIFHGKLPIVITKKVPLQITPFVLARITPNAPIQYDLSLITDYAEKFWVSATYKSNYAFAVSAGIKLYNALSLGYSYDIITNSLRSYSGRSTEIVAQYAINSLAKNKEKLLVDTDGDGVADEFDLEPNTRTGALVNFQGKTIQIPVSLAGGTKTANGMKLTNPFDKDNDLIADSIDVEPNTPAGLLVDSKGRRIGGDITQDLDGDGVKDDIDQELNTVFGAKVDGNGKRIIGEFDDFDKDGVLDRIDEDLNTQPGVTVDRYGRQKGGLYDLDNDGVADSLDLDNRTQFGHEVDRLGQSITLVITPPAYETSFFFDVDKTAIRPGNDEKFVAIAKSLNEHPDFVIKLSGHTDSRGSAAYNLNLGQKRAQAIANKLITEYNIPAERISVVMSKGKTELVSKSKHHVNRRVDVSVEKFIAQ